MSRAGRPKDDGHVVMHPTVPGRPAGTPEPVEMPPDVAARLDRWQRSERVFHACQYAIVRRHPPLWPPGVVGASIADQWMQNLARAMAAARARLVVPA